MQVRILVGTKVMGNERICINIANIYLMAYKQQDVSSNPDGRKKQQVVRVI